MTKQGRQADVVVAARSGKMPAAVESPSTCALIGTGATPTSSRSNSISGRVLVVDDHRQARESMAHVLRAARHQVEAVASASEALRRLDKEKFDCIVTDLQMPGMSGLEFIHHLERQSHRAEILMVTAHATVASAVEALRHGAFDYIEKPFDVDELERLVARAIHHRRLLSAHSKVPNSAAGSTVMIGSSAPMKALRARIVQVARTSETVLIVGESGTGKELVARAIHAASARSQFPLVSLNCPVLSAPLMESELFGHERGAFSGVECRRTGRFELADRGTILLDEVTKIDLPLQAKLLRVLQEKSFERIGSHKTIPVDVRMLAISNRNLQAEIAAGRFREDLYFRLSAVPLCVPPLRDRRDDIPELIAHFLFRSAQRLQRDPCDLEPAAIELLCEYSWPGNVRELENIISRASVLNTGGPITADEFLGWLSLHGNPAGGIEEEQGSTGAEHLGALIQGMATGLSLEAMEHKLIEAALERFGGHRAKAAQALGIGLRTLSGKIKKYRSTPQTHVFAKAG